MSRTIHRVTAHNRELAFQAFNEFSATMVHYRKAKSADDRAFELDVMRNYAMSARRLRLENVDYPSIP